MAPYGDTAPISDLTSPLSYLHTLALDAEMTVAERHGFVMQAALPPSQRLIVNAEVARLLKQNRYDPVSKTLTFTEAEAASYQRQIGLWTKYFKDASRRWRPSARLHQRPCAASPTDLVLCVGGVGFGHGSAGTQLLVHEQFSV